MTFADLWSDLAPIVTGALGDETVILTRASPQFEDTSTSTPPGVLRLASAALAGATALTLELPSEQVLAGTLQAGARLTIGAVDYTVAADAPATGATLAVTLTAGLQAPAADEAPVTVHPEAVFTLTGCQVAKRRKNDFARPGQADHFATVTVHCKGAPTTPRMNDMLRLPDGTVGRVANQVISTGAFWKLSMGA